MPLSYSNAINNKINPSPLGPIKQKANPFMSTQTGNVGMSTIPTAQPKRQGIVSSLQQKFHNIPAVKKYDEQYQARGGVIPTLPGTKMANAQGQESGVDNRRGYGQTPEQQDFYKKKGVYDEAGFLNYLKTKHQTPSLTEQTQATVGQPIGTQTQQTTQSAQAPVQQTPAPANTNQTQAQQPVQAPAPQVQPAVTPTFRGFIGGLAQQAGTPGQNMQDYQNSLARNTQLGEQAQRIASEAGQRMEDIGRQSARAQAGYLTTGTSPVAEGNAAIQAQTAAAQQQAVAQGAQTALTGNQQALGAQGQLQSGFGNIGSLQQGALNVGAGQTAPRAYDPYSSPYFAESDSFGGGGMQGRADRVLSGTNLRSLGDIQGQINTIQSQAQAAKANFDQLASIAQQGGVDPNAPILTTLTQRFAQFGGTNSPQVQAFLSHLEAVRSQYRNLTGSEIPDNITLTGLQAIQNALNGTIQNNLRNLQSQRDFLGQGSSGGGSENDPLGIL